jgi:hypothetical protein
MHKSIADYKIKPGARMAHWATLLDSWINVQEMYVAKTKDAAYWYTERTNVGILAQAAWKSDFIALEEYQTKKMAHHDPTAESNGRCDLWISGAKVSDVIEAKQQYIQLGLARNTAVVNSHLLKATADAKRTVGTSGGDALGLVFLPTYYPVANCQPRALEIQVAKSIELINASTADLVAWCFPGASRAFKGRNGVNYIPGLFMVASVIAGDA